MQATCRWLTHRTTSCVTCSSAGRRSTPFWTSVPRFLPDGHRLYALLMRTLSRLALVRASAAFNADKQELCNRIADFALEICPDADRSVAWRKLALKRKLGHRFTTALLPLAGAARHVASALRTLRYGG